MTAGSPVAAPAQGFVPLAQLLRDVGPIKLYEARRRVSAFGRDELLANYRAAISQGQRKRGFLMAEGLVALGIPPFVWHELMPPNDSHVNQRYDQFIADLLWLRRHYPNHTKIVRYQRCKALLTGNEAVFHHEAEYMWYGGRRPAWKMVGSLSMSAHQQWEAAFLRSAPIKKRAAMTEAMSASVFKALQDDLRAVRRTASFGESEATVSLQRRHILWRCSRMADRASPTATAALFEQLTGTVITRQAVAQQLEKVKSVLLNAKVTFSA